MSNINNTSGMHLYLVNNDPMSTLLVTSDGTPMFSIETPSSKHISDPSKELSSSSTATAETALKQLHGKNESSDLKTTIVRLESHHGYRCTGKLEVAIGVVEYRGLSVGTRVEMSENGVEVNVPPYRMVKAIQMNGLGDSDSEVPSNEGSWSFIGPESTEYNWHLICQCPVLTIGNQTSLTALARYRRAKIGIVSRPRRAFLEILPAGLGIIDLIVVTFVGFMKQRLIIDSQTSTSAAIVSTTFDNSALLPPPNTRSLPSSPN